jgi:hypothetical protein
MSKLPIMPVFQQFPKEAGTIGRLLAGYGELEFEFMLCLKTILGDMDTAIRVVYRLQNESQRLTVIDSLIREPYENEGLSAQYSDAYGAIKFCKKIRNQYAHCHWANYGDRGLVFTNFQDAADHPKPALTLNRVDTTILAAQEAYFEYAFGSLTFLHQEMCYKRGKIQKHPFSMPPKLEPPKLRNPPLEQSNQSQGTSHSNPNQSPSQ